MNLPVRSMGSREFNQGTGAAKVAALSGPVYVTDRGRPSHVLLSYDHYRQLVKENQSLADVLCNTPGAGDIDLEVPERDSLGSPAVFD